MADSLCTSVIKDGILRIDLRPVINGSLAEVQQGLRVVALALWQDRVIKNAVFVLWRVDLCCPNLFFIAFCYTYDYNRFFKKINNG